MPNEFNLLNRIATRIIQIRGDMTKHEFAISLGVTEQAVSTWENAVTMPRIDALEKISKIYGVPKSYILGDDSDSFKPETKKTPLLEKSVPIIDSVEPWSDEHANLTDDEIIEIAEQMESMIQYVKSKRKNNGM